VETTRQQGLPGAAAWRHHTARTGFEVVFVSVTDAGFFFEGESTAVEEGRPWSVRYKLHLDPDWRLRTAHVAGHSASGHTERVIEHDGTGWWVDGRQEPWLHDCADLDLEASALTNAFPVHRLGLTVGESADAPAAWVRAVDLGVEPLRQRYRRLPDHDADTRYDYTAPDLDFQAQLVYDASGLVVDYPGIASRAL
jgi:uncharacterized protein